MSEPGPTPGYTPCAAWPSTLEVRGPDHFREILAELAAAVERGELRVLQASPGFDEIMRDGQWTQDGFLWIVQCQRTGKCFRLAADTYHGRAVWEEVVREGEIWQRASLLKKKS